MNDILPFNGSSLNIDTELPGYNPDIEPGIVVFDNNNVMCMVSRVFNYSDVKIMFSYQNNIKIEGKEYIDWKTFNLLDLIDEKLPRADPYNLFTNSETIVFDSDNNVYIVYNKHLIKFDYRKVIILDIIGFDFDIRMEVKSCTNDCLYNGFPIVTSEGPSVSLYSDGSYKTYNMDSKMSLFPNKIVETIVHSGKYSCVYTFSGRTYFVFSTLHDPGIQDSKGMPNWITYFDHTTLKWLDNTVLLGIVGKYKDDHNGPSLTITSKGHIYVFFGNHLEPIYYTFCKKALDLDSFKSPIRFPKVKGEGGNSRWYTYPGVRIDAFDNIHITYRGPWYAFTYFKMNTSNNRISHKTLISMKRIYSLGGTTLSNINYRAYRSAMSIDKKGNVYILVSPSVHGSWDAPPYSKTGPFVLFSKAGKIDFKLMSLVFLDQDERVRLEERLEMERVRLEERLEMERVRLEERLEMERVRIEESRLESGKYVKIDVYGKSGEEIIKVSLNDKLIETVGLSTDYKKNLVCHVGDIVSITFMNDKWKRDVFIRDLCYDPEGENLDLTKNIIKDSFNARKLDFIKMGRLYWGATYRFKVEHANMLKINLSGKSGTEKVFLLKNGEVFQDITLKNGFSGDYSFKDSDIITIQFRNDSFGKDVYIKELTYKNASILGNIIKDKFDDRKVNYIKNGQLLWTASYRFSVKPREDMVGVLKVRLSGRSGTEKVYLSKNGQVFQDMTLSNEFYKEYYFQDSDVFSIKFINDASKRDVYIKELTYKNVSILGNIIKDKFDDRKVNAIKNGKLLWNASYNFVMKN